jgi:hypothetical protein
LRRAAVARICGAMPVSRPSPARTAACVLIAAAALMSAGCRNNPPEPPRSALAQTEPTVDAGAPVLAAVLNARAGIAAGDALAAYNDANAGLRYAVGLAGADSALYPAPVAPPGYHSAGGAQGGQGGAGGRGGGRRHRGGGAAASAGGDAAQAAPAPVPASAPATAAPPPAGHGGHHGHGGHNTQAGGGDHAGQGGAGGAQSSTGEPQAAAPFTSFDAQVRLVSALARLQAHDPAGADVELQAIEAAVHPQQMPAYLPLIRASQSLTLASAAVSGGRVSELRTQLTAAQSALEAYQGAPHATEARALAAAIGEGMRGPGGLAALQPVQIALWAGVVGAWT